MPARKRAGEKMDDLFYQILNRAVMSGVYMERKEAKLRKALRYVKSNCNSMHDYMPLVHRSRQMAEKARERYGTMPIIDRKSKKIAALCDRLEHEIRKYETIATAQTF